MFDFREPLNSYIPRGQFYSRLSGRSYLLCYIFKGFRVVDRIAHEDNVGIGVGKGSKALKLLTTVGIPKRQFDFAAIYLDVRNPGIKASR